MDESGECAVITLFIGAAIGGAGGGIIAAATHSDVLNGVIVGTMTGAAIGSGVVLMASLPSASTLAGSFVTSIFGFTGNLTAQALVYKSINMAEALTNGAMAGLGYAYGSLFSAIGKTQSDSFVASFTREFASGSSFMSLDLASNFVSGAGPKNSRVSSSPNTSIGREDKFSMGNFQLSTSYGN